MALHCKVELLERRCELIQANMHIIKEDYQKKLDAVKQQVFVKDQMIKSKFKVGLYYPMMAQKIKNVWFSFSNSYHFGFFYLLYKLTSAG